MKMDYTHYDADKQVSRHTIIVDTVDSLRSEILNCVEAGDWKTAEILSKEIESLLFQINS